MTVLQSMATMALLLWLGAVISSEAQGTRISKAGAGVIQPAIDNTALLSIGPSYVVVKLYCKNGEEWAPCKEANWPGTFVGIFDKSFKIGSELLDGSNGLLMTTVEHFEGKK